MTLYSEMFGASEGQMDNPDGRTAEPLAGRKRGPYVITTYLFTTQRFIDGFIYT